MIARHKTAISRTELSRPIKHALADGILKPRFRIFDYGCGLGDDLRLLTALGFQGRGWDPVHRKDAKLCRSPIVNLGYVVNVIESVSERQDTLRRAWSLTERVLLVSARLTAEARSLRETSDFEDGYLTTRGTFQKFFEQQELRYWINHTLQVSAVPAAPGVFYVFRDEEDRSSFVASRYRRVLAAPRLTRSAELFTKHEELLKPLMDFVGNRGRLPHHGELSNANQVCEVFGSIRKAFRVILRVTDVERWDQIRNDRAQDLLIYLALSQFEGRPRFGGLSRTLQADVKEFFSSYKKACTKADSILFSLGEQQIIEIACRDSEVGKLTPSALYVHESAVGALSPLLRLYEGCAQGYLGRIEGANIIKLYRREPKISYLNYPEFMADPHPALISAITVNLQTFHIKIRGYQSYRNSPILHRKELFLCSDHPLFAKFARLTRIEEAKGLYETPSRIGTRDGWNDILVGKGLYLKGHRLLSVKQSDQKT